MRSEQSSDTESNKEKPTEEKVPEKKTIIAYIDPVKIKPFIPENIATKINKANE